MHAFVLTAFVLNCFGALCQALVCIGSASSAKQTVALCQLALNVGFATWAAKLLWF